jgi:hypothetical protein
MPTNAKRPSVLERYDTFNNLIVHLSHSNRIIQFLQLAYEETRNEHVLRALNEVLHSKESLYHEFWELETLLSVNRV